MSFSFQTGLLHIDSDQQAHGITLLPAYILTHLNMEAEYLSWGQLLLEWHLLHQMAQAAFPPVGPSER